MAFRATCCGLILSLITRLPRFTGDQRLIGVPAQQSGEQSNRPFLNVRRQHLKGRAKERGMKQRRLRDSKSASGPWHQHLPEQSREWCGACSTSARGAVCNTAFNSINA